MWIKICGLTTPDAVRAALEAGVDAMGFVFSPSPRQLPPQTAAALARPARGRTLCVAVFAAPSQAEVDGVLEHFRPDLLQADAASLAGLRLPSALDLLPVYRSDAATPARVPPRLLFEGARSGTGTQADWLRANALARTTRLVLAGGLSADNVEAAIGFVRPHGVDVSSGVEQQRGVKSPVEIQRFVTAARAAFARLAA